MPLCAAYALFLVFYLSLFYISLLFLFFSVLPYYDGNRFFLLALFFHFLFLFFGVSPFLLWPSLVSFKLHIPLNNSKLFSAKYDGVSSCYTFEQHAHDKKKFK